MEYFVLSGSCYQVFWGLLTFKMMLLYNTEISFFMSNSQCINYTIKNKISNMLRPQWLQTFCTLKKKKKLLRYNVQCLTHIVLQKLSLGENPFIQLWYDFPYFKKTLLQLYPFPMLSVSFILLLAHLLTWFFCPRWYDGIKTKQNKKPTACSIP